MTTRLKAVPNATAEVVNITPALAADWLALNAKNRNLRQHIVDAYARDMTAGEWHFTGEPIKFEGRGDLIDGQHRLMAIMRCGKTVPMLVVRGLRADVQDFMDSGIKRSVADMLSLQGHTSATVLASTARFGVIVEAGGRKGMSGRPVTKSEIAAYINATPDLTDAASAASSLARYLPFSPTALAYSWMLLSRVDRTECSAFFDSLANNATKGKGDPRNTLLRRMNAAKRAAERLSADDQVQFIVRTWNACRKGADLHILKARVETAEDGTVKRVTIPQAV